MDEENEKNITHQQDESYKLSSDIRFNGFDPYTGQTWIYPTNLPLRQYQFDIVQTALHHNTLVSLPTGLGKTFIAAVVIYNIYRWYPLCRIVFMAPTRPLVAQQAVSCRKITGIPFEHTAELTGRIHNKSRTDIWNKARVIFLTPQVLHRDLQSGICPAHLIRCLVFDEAHKTTGNHAYCEVIRSLGDNITKIRVLALSATPGSTATKVAEIIRTLKISRFEIRTENSPDVMPYVFSKSIETIVVQLGEPLSTIRDEYILILDFYTRRLMKIGLLNGSAKNLHKGHIFVIKKQYIANCQRKGQKPDSTISQDLFFCMTLYHAYDILIKHGLRGFSSFFEEHKKKAWLMKNNNLMSLLERIRKHLNKKLLTVDLLPDGTVPEIPKDVIFGHPKYLKLRNIVETHFKNIPDSKVMVFCEYKETVLEAYGALLTCRPVVQPRMFLGKSSLPQKQQLMIVKQFQLGEINTLVCTSVAEEGLDFTLVDLIVCFDIANRSPIRLAQRMGRTGRHQAGKIVMLVTEGREKMVLSDSINQSGVLNSKLLQSPEVISSLSSSGPPILPPNLNLQCIRMHITIPDDVQEPDSHKKKQKKRSRELVKQLSDTSVLKNSNLSEESHFPNIINFNSEKFLWNKGKDTLINGEISKQNDVSDSFDRYSSFKFRYVQPFIVKHSDDTLLLQSLFKKSDEIKFNLPFRKLSKDIKTRNQDIRHLFGKSTQSQQDETDFIPVNKAEQTKNCKSPNNSEISIKRSALLKSIHHELNNRKFIESSLELPNINISCKNIFDHNKLYKPEDLTKMNIECIPYEQILQTLTSENLNNLNISDLITLNCNTFNSETCNLLETSPDKNLFEDHTSVIVNENSFLDDSNFFHDPYFDDDSVDYNSIDLLETSEVDFSSVKSNNEFGSEDSRETINSHHESQTIVPFLNTNNCISSPNMKDWFSQSKLSEETKNFSSNNIVSCSVSNNFIKSEQSVKNDTKLNYSEVNNIEKTHILSGKQKSNNEEYVPDEKSQKTLFFFGLSCIEDLFKDTDVTLKNDILIKKSDFKNHELISADIKNTQQIINDDIIDLCLSENESEVKNTQQIINDNIIDLCSSENESEVNLLNNTPDSSVILNSFACNRDVHSLKQCSPTFSNQTSGERKISKSLSFSSSKSKNISTGNNGDNFDLWDDTLFESVLSDEENHILIEKSHLSDTKKYSESNTGICKIINSDESKSDKNISVFGEPESSSLKLNKSVSKEENESCNDDDSDFLSITDVLNAIDKNNISTRRSISKSPVLTSQKKRKNRTQTIFKNKDRNKCSYDCSKRISEDTSNQLPMICMKENKLNSSIAKASEVYANKGYDFEEYKFSTKKIPSVDKENSFGHDNKKKYKHSKSKNISVSKNQSLEEQAYAEKGFNFTCYASDEDIFSDDEFSQVSNASLSKLNSSSKQQVTSQCTVSVDEQRKKRKRCEFINDEAEVTDDESSDTEENDDEMNDSFVVQDPEPNVNSKMHAYYLKSIRSPSKRLKHDAFKIPHVPAIKISDVCSQQNWKNDDCYEHDSFCVDSSTVEIENNSELSFLEVAEKKIECDRKNRKRKRILSKIKQYSSSSDDEELKVMREECLQNKTIMK